MKSTIKLIALFIVSTLIISCSTENDIYEDSKLEEIIGGKKWNCVSIIEKNTNNVVSTCTYDDSFEFLVDNACNLYAGSIVCEIDQLAITPGTYEISEDDKSLEIVFDGFMSFEYEVYDSSEDELILEHTINGKEVLSTFELEN